MMIPPGEVHCALRRANRSTWASGESVSGLSSSNTAPCAAAPAVRRMSIPSHCTSSRGSALDFCSPSACACAAVEPAMAVPISVAAPSLRIIAFIVIFEPSGKGRTGRCDIK
ncbi:hypothetical protein [Erythrobacter donghaensis]|jgi:hypothetical protein|uniref:hypothetical protein n=1 Tax=Erythrobacter donghaensis TaxID=267135 RepID=UPI0018C7048B|nr:hypothetical protein [Erythrobacter donghaensis]